MNVYKEIYQSNLTKTLLFKSNSFSSDSVTFFFPMQISINILNSVRGEPLQNKNILMWHTFGSKKKENPTHTGLNKNGVYWFTSVKGP